MAWSLAGLVPTHVARCLGGSRVLDRLTWEPVAHRGPARYCNTSAWLMGHLQRLTGWGWLCGHLSDRFLCVLVVVQLSPETPQPLSCAHRFLTWQGQACKEEAFLEQGSRELVSREALVLDRARSPPRIMRR